MPVPPAPVRLLVLALAALAAPAADLAPGLVATYYDGWELVDGWPKLAGRQPTLLRVEPKVDYASTDGEFAKSKLADNFSVRWTGVLRVEQAGAYGFATWSDDGSRVLIDGAMVVDNGGMHGFTRKDGHVELTAGDHPLVVEFFEGGGGAGCRLAWTPPGGAEVVVPATALGHDPALEREAWDADAWAKRKVAKSDAVWARMDYGPFLSATVETTGPQRHFANKAIAIRLAAGEDEEAGILFDTDLCAYAAGWTGGWLEVRGVAFDGSHGTQPQIAGDVLFSAPAEPGAADAQGSFADPRPQPYGPLPRAHARWRGLHLDGREVTLSYRVGATDVREAPSLIVAGERRAFARRIDVAPGERAIALLVCEVAGGAPIAGGDGVALAADGVVTAAQLIGGAPGARLRLDGQRVVLDLPRAGARATLVVWSGPTDERAAAMQAVVAAAPAPIDLASRIGRGGAARWKEPVVTAGVRAADDAAYVVDTLTLPEKNPWSAWMRPGGLDFFSDGRAAISTWSGDVWVVSGIDAGLKALSWRRYATGLFQPLGLRIVDDVVYVHGRDQITRLRDLDGDGEADAYECFNNDVLVTPNFHEFAFDLQTGPDGAFYCIKGSPVRPGGDGFDTITASHGCVFRISRDGATCEAIATGFRAPNGMGVGPHGEITSGDNQGTWTPACRINVIRPGGFYGVVDTAHRPQPPTDYDRPLCWLPMSLDNSSGGQAWVPGGDRWGPLGGQLLHTSYGSCSLFLVLRQAVGEQWQGGVVRLPCGFLSGIMRPRFNGADGQLYVCGLKGWQTTAQRDGCLQRVRWTGKPARLPIALTASAGTVTIAFSDALDAELAADPANYRLEHWNYRWTAGYGSPDFKPSKPDEQGRETLAIAGATLAADARTVTLSVPGLIPVMQLSLHYKLATADGEPLEQEIAATIHALPPH